MNYLVELTKEMSAKNKPQLEVINLLKAEYHRRLIDQSQLKPVVNEILGKIRNISLNHPRCKAIDVVFSESSNDRNFEDAILYHPDLFTIHFKGSR